MSATVLYYAGDYTEMGCQWAYLFVDSNQLMLGITEEREVLLDFCCGGGVYSLGPFPEAPLPPEDDSLHDTFDWDEWGLQVREALDKQGIN